MRSEYRCVIIGSGPAGLAAAVKLAREGMTDFILIERERETGGILNQCIHTGFGLELYKEDLTGPEFACRLKNELEILIAESADRTQTPPVVLRASMVRKVEKLPDDRFIVRISSKESGLLSIKTGVIITATGCRERTRENIEVAGSRPAGIYTAGQAQNLINRKHYAPGKRVIIQGSGDIGLIMARRLTIEGFNVVAVLERLPWLSGLIRNKVQCLDHFGIKLHLGRQITEICGRGRVSSVISRAVGTGGELLPGSEIEFECDTVLFAVGLIPELESVKPAGVRLPDNFHPKVNSLYETNIPGLFAAGNCLHINDLADSAAAEGIRTADFVLEYIRKNEDFRRKAENAAGKLPYAEPQPKKDLNSDFFKRIEAENYLVCIVCPKGCLLREGEYGCRRGEEYFRRTASPSGGYSQRVSTTVEVNSTEQELQRGLLRTVIVPAVSKEEIPVGLIPEAVKKLKDASGAGCSQSEIIISADGRDFTFTLCRVE